LRLACACKPLDPHGPPAGPFWEAEPEHQDYLERYPDGYTCHFIRPGWKLSHRAQPKAS
jgi:peptide-methionine (S)-S-oxide reductase